MKLNEAIEQGKFKLTEKEQEVLQAIRGQGSYYEESLCGEEFKEQAFLGYRVMDSDVDFKFHTDGVVSSLVKKGILVVGDPIGDGSIGYWINYELEFDDAGDIKFPAPAKVETTFVYRVELLNHSPLDAGLDFDWNGWWNKMVNEYKMPVIHRHEVMNEQIQIGEVYYNATLGYAFKPVEMVATFQEEVK